MSEILHPPTQLRQLSDVLIGVAAYNKLCNFPKLTIRLSSLFHSSRSYFFLFYFSVYKWVQHQENIWGETVLRFAPLSQFEQLLCLNPTV